MRIRTATYGATMRFGMGHGNTWITYKGAAGSVDVPIFIFDCFLFDEFGHPPSGRASNSTMSGGISVEIEGLTFRGNDTDMNSATPPDTHFVSALRIRKACFSKIHECTFAGSLWDGVRFTDAQ